MSSTGRLALHFRRLQNSGLHGLFLNCPPSQPFVKWKSCRNEPGRLSSSSGNLKLPKDVHSREAVRWSFTISFKGKKHVRTSRPQRVQSFCAQLRFHLAVERLHRSAPNLHSQGNLFYGLAVAPSPTTLCYLYSLFFTPRFSAGPWFRICSCPIKKKLQCGTAMRMLFAVSTSVFITIMGHPPTVAERK